jgi:hypothetical protein
VIVTRHAWGEGDRIRAKKYASASSLLDPIPEWGGVPDMDLLNSISLIQNML